MPLKSPVGRLTPLLLNLMHGSDFVKWSEKPFTLKSGKQSYVYVSGREDVTDNPEFLYLLGVEIMHAVWIAVQDDVRQPCLIGIPTAGTALAGAASMASYSEQRGYVPRYIASRIMREMRKTHGTHTGWVNGIPNITKHAYCLIDNVVTDGASKIETAERLREDGYPPVHEIPVVILVDREQGGVRELQNYGFKNIAVVFTLRDIIKGFKDEGLWTPELADRALEELP